MTSNEKLSITSFKYFTNPQEQLDRISRLFRVRFDEYETIALVNYKNIDVGVLILSKIEGEYALKIFQFPYVCRLSIIALIESSLIFLKELNLDCNSIRIKDVIAYKFKLKIILGENVVDDEDSFDVIVNNIFNSLSVDQITRKTIIVNL